MNIANPKTLRIINGLPPVAQKGDKVSLDTEFFGMDKKRLHRPHGQFAYLGCSYDGQTVYWTDDESQIGEFLRRIDAAVWIFANAKFDIRQARRYTDVPRRKRLWDVILIEQIMYSGYYSDFSLQDLVRRYLDEYMPKDIRTTFVQGEVGSPLHEQGGMEVQTNVHPLASLSDTVSMTPEQIEYASADVAYTWRVYTEQRKIISETDLSIWTEIELPFMWTLLSMGGMMMDKEAWMALYERNMNDALCVQKKYMENPEILEEMSWDEALRKKKFKGINLGSWQQVKAHLQSLGYKVRSTQEDDIAPWADKCEFVRDVLEFRGKRKAAGTYGKSWIEDGLIEADGRVYSAFNQIGASTGRLSSSNPNVENIPVRETPDFRKCFIAAPGKILVDADWSAQEPRIFAYQSQDEKLIQIFREHKDVYIEAGRLMFGWELTKKDPRRKERMKPTVLGASYGLTEYGMEKKYEIPKEEGKELLDTFFETFEGAAEYKKQQIKIKTYVQTIYGRKFWLNIYQKGYENNSLNSPTQGSAGDAMKLAGAQFLERVGDAGYYKRVEIINFIHDEILIECDEDLLEWTETNLREVMIGVAEEMHEGIPADVEINHGHSWHEAHN